jgi:hypothetical protein
MRDSAAGAGSWAAGSLVPHSLSILSGDTLPFFRWMRDSAAGAGSWAASSPVPHSLSILSGDTCLALDGCVTLLLVLAPGLLAVLAEIYKCCLYEGKTCRHRRRRQKIVKRFVFFSFTSHNAPNTCFLYFDEKLDKQIYMFKKCGPYGTRKASTSSSEARHLAHFLSLTLRGFSVQYRGDLCGYFLYTIKIRSN